MTTFAPFSDWLAAQDAPEDLKTVVAAVAAECVARSEQSRRSSTSSPTTC
jgi:hypothetical protein